MKTLTLILTLVLIQACGQGATDLANSIDKATAAQKEKQTKDSSSPVADTQEVSSGNKTTTTITASSSVTITTTTDSVVEQPKPGDELIGSWVSDCDAGVTTTLVFDGSKMISITSVYSDVEACTDMPKTFANSTTYRIVGDNGISIGKSDVREFEVSNRTLILDNNYSKTYRTK